MPNYECTHNGQCEALDGGTFKYSEGQVICGEDIPSGSLEAGCYSGTFVETDKKPKKPSSKAVSPASGAKSVAPVMDSPTPKK